MIDKHGPQTRQCRGGAGAHAGRPRRCSARPPNRARGEISIDTWCRPRFSRTIKDGDLRRTGPPEARAGADEAVPAPIADASPIPASPATTISPSNNAEAAPEVARPRAGSFAGRRASESTRNFWMRDAVSERRRRQLLIGRNSRRANGQSAAWSPRHSAVAYRRRNFSKSEALLTRGCERSRASPSDALFGSRFIALLYGMGQRHSGKNGATINPRRSPDGQLIIAAAQLP